MKSYQPGEVVLLSFPFADATGAKRLPSVVRVHKLATLEKRLVERKLGTLTSGDWRQVQAVMRQVWGLE